MEAIIQPREAEFEACALKQAPSPNRDGRLDANRRSIKKKKKIGNGYVTNVEFILKIHPLSVLRFRFKSRPISSEFLGDYPLNYYLFRTAKRYSRSRMRITKALKVLSALYKDTSHIIIPSSSFTSSRLACTIKGKIQSSK